MKIIKRKTAQQILNSKIGNAAFNAVVMPSLFILAISAATFMVVTQKKS